MTGQMISDEMMIHPKEKGRGALDQAIKSSFLLVLAFALPMIAGCGGTGSIDTSPPPPSKAVHNEWTWVSGSNATNTAGVYGTQGVAAAGNSPGARSYAVSSTDNAANLWLFGGIGNDSIGNGSIVDLNDLWKFSGGTWEWMSGSSTGEQAGTYGTRGVASASNVPGARYQSVSWTDAAGNFWLYGGLGIDGTGHRGTMNDLWRFSNGQWTWMGGSSSSADNVPAVFGAVGSAALGNQPGARTDASSWTDPSGNLWLFGGLGYDSTGTLGILNDLWKYSGGQWTWMSGSNLVAALGAYGTQGTAAVGNAPGARTSAVTWTDAAGSLWLFGGEGNDSDGIICQQHSGFCPLNDLWRYSGGQWTWINGSNFADQHGTYGTQGVAAAGNVPGGRLSAVGWIDATGNFWLFGGYGFDSTVGPPYIFGDLSDLWKYSNGTWTWMDGPNTAGQPATYGILGMAAVGDNPGARNSAIGWVDLSGNLWLFGGQSQSGKEKHNDLWEFQP